MIEGKKKQTRSQLGLLDLDPAPKFDLVIVDEAHHIRNSDTYLHKGVRYFCDNAEAVILLTATPVQLGSNDLYTLLNVLRPDLVIDKASYEQMAQPNPFINNAVQICRSGGDDWQERAIEELNEAIQTEWGSMFIKENPVFQNIYDQLSIKGLDNSQRVSLVHEIEGLYTFSSIINRTRRRDIGEFTSRRAETLLVDFTNDQAQLHNKLLEIIENILLISHEEKNIKFMMTTVRRQAASCIYGLAPLLKDWLLGKVDQLEMMELADDDDSPLITFIDAIRDKIEQLVIDAEKLDPIDPKVESLLKVIKDKNSLENNKALLFSTFRHTLAYLSSKLEQTTIRFGLIHGGIPDEERADLRWRFSLPKEDERAIDVLLSSEVGCEGLDFQFCDLLINYDLPWNPMRIEQRIGRIDRYGQKSETVAIVNIITPDTVDADIYDRCLSRIGVFERAVGGSEEILGTIATEIHNIADNFKLGKDERKARLQQLADNNIRIVREEAELENQQASLFGLDIPKQSWEEDVKNAEDSWLSSDNISSLVSLYLSKRLMTEHDVIRGMKSPKTLRLSSEARLKLLEDFNLLPKTNDLQYRNWGKWLKGSEQILKISFDQEDAMNYPGTIHLSVLHPIAKQAAYFFKKDQVAYTSIEVETDKLPIGTYNFTLYSWTIKGIKKDQKIVAVADNKEVEDCLLDLLQENIATSEKPVFDEEIFNKLDNRHHKKWDDARANHIEENQGLLEHRALSLKVSYAARKKLLENRLNSETSEKIVKMKQGELSRIELDFKQHINEIEKASASADILATPTICGVLTVGGTK